MEYRYKPEGVCSREMVFDIENGVITSFKAVGGCPGNLAGISRLLKGMKVEDVVEKLSGTKCGARQTSCPDQIALALKKYLDEK